MQRYTDLSPCAYSEGVYCVYLGICGHLLTAHGVRSTPCSPFSLLSLRRTTLFIHVEASRPSKPSRAPERNVASAVRTEVSALRTVIPRERKGVRRLTEATTRVGRNFFLLGLLVPPWPCSQAAHGTSRCRRIPFPQTADSSPVLLPYEHKEVASSDSSVHAHEDLRVDTTVVVVIECIPKDGYRTYSNTSTCGGPASREETRFNKSKRGRKEGMAWAFVTPSCRALRGRLHAVP